MARDARAEGVDWAHVRSQFPATRDQAYLDCATWGPCPLGVHERFSAASRLWLEGRGVWRDWELAGESARETFARLMGTSSATIALLPSVSSAAGQIAERLPRTKTGANVVVGESEFRSNLFPWLAQSERGLEVRCVPFRDGMLRARDLEARIDAATQLVAVSSVQSANGYRIDLERVGAACRRHGALLFVDATQSFGALRFPTGVADFVAVGAYKWLLSPRGSAFLYVREDLIGEILPVAAGWKTPSDPYGGYYGPPLELSATASRFDVSLPWLIWEGTAAALEFVQQIGIEHIEAKNLGLARSFAAGAAEIGLELALPGGGDSHIVGLRLEDTERVEAELKRRQVRVAVRNGYLRASFHFFNDESDVERALAALRAR